MVSTYLSFDLVNRDMAKSLSQVASQTQVTNDTKYYQDNIGKVKTVDDFLDNYRLYSYAMTAYGLGDMTYAKAFMKQVLTSDLSDASSFANRLTDDRYKDFAAAFNFGTTAADTAVAQSEGQTTKLFDTYDQTIAAQDDKTAEDTTFFEKMFGTASNIKNVDQFLQSDQLRQYVFTAYGVDDKYFNYTALKGVLTSDPNDPNSYYQQAYGSKLDAVTNAQTEYDELNERDDLTTSVPQLQDSVTLGTQRQSDLQSQIADKQSQLDNGGDAATLQPAIDALNDQLTQTTTLLQQDQDSLTTGQARLDDLNSRLVPASQKAARQNALTGIINSMSTSDQNYMTLMKSLMEDFNFNSDGTVPATGALSADKIQDVVAGFFNKQTHVSQAEADFNQDYFEQKVKTATNVTDLTDDPRTFQYLKVAFNLNDVTVVPSTIKNILTSDLNDPNSYINTFGAKNPDYIALRNAFNFAADGTATAGQAQNTAQTNTTRNNYMSRYDDAESAQHDKDVKFYKTDMAQIKTLDDFLSDDAETTYDLALKAVGLDPTQVTKQKIRQVLTSDLSDPKSYIYSLKDERFVTLAKLFNFDAKGKVTAPVMAQSNATITNVAKDYVLRQTRFLTGADLDAAKKKATDDSTYYTTTIQSIDTRDELLKNRKLLDIALTAQGIDPKTVTDDFLKQAFTSDLSDPKSFVNQQADRRFAEIVGSFNFDANGNIDRSKSASAQNGGAVVTTTADYLRETLETQQGDDNPGVRLALYFERKADSITDPYVILGDDALAEFFRVTYQLPDSFSNMDVDQQAKVVTKNLDLKDLSDPDKLKKLLTRFTTMYDLENSDVSTAPAVALLTDDGSAGISADTLWALSQLKSG